MTRSAKAEERTRPANCSGIGENLTEGRDLDGGCHFLSMDEALGVLVLEQFRQGQGTP